MMPLLSRTFTGTAKDHIKNSKTPGTITRKRPMNTAMLISRDIATTPINWLLTREYKSITLAGLSR